MRYMRQAHISRCQFNHGRSFLGNVYFSVCILSTDTSNCVIKVERFIAHGIRDVLSSNNGTKFFAEEGGLLQQIIRKWNQHVLVSLDKNYIIWKFNLLCLPLCAGTWERLLKNFNHVVNAIIGNGQLTGENLDRIFFTVSKVSLNFLYFQPTHPNQSEAVDCKPLPSGTTQFKVCCLIFQTQCPWTDLLQKILERMGKAVQSHSKSLTEQVSFLLASLGNQ